MPNIWFLHGLWNRTRKIHETFRPPTQPFVNESFFIYTPKLHVSFEELTKVTRVSHVQAVSYSKNGPALRPGMWC